MSVLITADLHLSANPRDEYRLAWQQKLRALARKHKAECVLILGDLTEEKDRHGAWLVNQVVQHLSELALICPVVILKGNHDYVDVSSPFFAFLGSVPGITWVGSPRTAETLPIPPLAGLKRVLFYPHGSKMDDPKGFDLVFAHDTFQGAAIGHSMRADHGLSPSLFGKAQVISGDIHIPQQVGQNVTYVGAPYTVDFGDDYEPRVLVLAGGKTISVPCPGPQKRLVDVVDGKFDKGRVTPGDILKVRVHLTSENRNDWHAIQKTIRDTFEEMGCIVHAVQPVLTDSRSRVSRKLSKPKTQSDKLLLLQYARARKIDESTTKVGLRLMRNA